MIYCSVKYCCSNSSIPGVILHSIMKSIKTPNHPAYHRSTLWPLEVWVRGLYNSWWFWEHKLSMLIYLSMEIYRPFLYQCCPSHCNNIIHNMTSTRAAGVHLDFRAGSTFRSQYVLYLAQWTGLAGATRLRRSDLMLHIGWIYFY